MVADLATDRQETLAKPGSWEAIGALTVGLLAITAVMTASMILFVGSILWPPLLRR
jgi:hypothetical protein